MRSCSTPRESGPGRRTASGSNGPVLGHLGGRNDSGCYLAIPAAAGTLPVPSPVTVAAVGEADRGLVPGPVAPLVPGAEPPDVLVPGAERPPIAGVAAAEATVIGKTVLAAALAVAATLPKKLLVTVVVFDTYS